MGCPIEHFCAEVSFSPSDRAFLCNEEPWLLRRSIHQPCISQQLFMNSPLWRLRDHLFVRFLELSCQMARQSAYCRTSDRTNQGGASWRKTIQGAAKRSPRRSSVLNAREAPWFLRTTTFPRKRSALRTTLATRSTWPDLPRLSMRRSLCCAASRSWPRA